MPLFLSQRQPELEEFMDRPDCDPVLLENTYRQFATINRLLSGWKKIYQKEIKPVLEKNARNTLLDIGFGGGDVPERIYEWASADGFKIEITAIETDKRAVNFVEENQKESSVHYQHISSSELVDRGEEFDIVISNHVLHHLGSTQTKKLLAEAKQLSRQKVIFSDIERSDLGFLLFASFAPLLFRHSFIVKDGLISIKRSYTRSELRQAVPAGWKVHPKSPFRLLLIHEK